MQIGDFVQFKTTNGHPTASSVGTSDIGEIMSGYNTDGKQFWDVVFQTYNGQVTGIPESMLVIYDPNASPTVWDRIKSFFGFG